jgi:trehalose/maltose hydrolase-like predicted phosphorylase
MMTCQSFSLHNTRGVTDTTLGNGYLGSRIDEERSKMRYLV